MKIMMKTINKIEIDRNIKTYDFAYKDDEL